MKLLTSLQLTERLGRFVVTYKATIIGPGVLIYSRSLFFTTTNYVTLMVNDPFNPMPYEFKDILFESVDKQYYLWCNLLNVPSLPTSSICSPFRIDRHPGCSFYVRDNVIFFMDGNAQNYPTASTILHIYMHVYGDNYSEALYRAHHILSGVKEIDSPTIIKQASSQIQKLNNFEFRLFYNPIAWTPKSVEKVGYGLFGKKELMREHCYPFEVYWKNTKHNPNELRSYKFKDFSYGYSYNRRIHKLRFYNVPKQYKWLSNVPKNYIGGFTNVDKNKILFVTKSLMDYLTISSLGYNCKFLASESVLPSEDFLIWCNSFPKTIFLSDYDKRGRKRANELQQLFKQEQYTNLYATTIKEYDDERITDTYDILKFINRNEVKTELNRIIYEAFSTKESKIRRMG